jgi:hypothetical protein
MFLSPFLNQGTGGGLGEGPEHNDDIDRAGVGKCT